MLDVQPNGLSSVRFWQRGGGYDRNFWSPKHTWQTIDYIHANPVVRGLCAGNVDWSWSRPTRTAATANARLTLT